MLPSGSLNQAARVFPLPCTSPWRVVPAAFVVASTEGSFGLAKAAQSATMLRSNLDVLGSFLESLRAVQNEGRKARVKPTGPKRRRA